MVYTKALQVFHIEVPQQLLLGSLLRKHPVVELEGKVFCTKATLKLLLLAPIVEHLLG